MNELDILKSAISQTLESPQSKLSLIKEEILAGRYEIHCDRIARKLLEYTESTQGDEILTEVV